MEIKEMTAEELEARQAEIITEIDSPEADLDALESEIRSIKAELEERKAAETKKAEIRASVAQGEGKVVKKMEVEERKIPTMEEIRNSKEYINAYANYIKTGDATECRSLLTENGSGNVPVPAMVYDIVHTAWEKDGIMSLIKKSYLKGNLKVSYEVSSSPAVVHDEGAAVDEEQLVLGIVELTPVSIKKWVGVSDEALDLRGEEFLRYIYDELTYRIAKAAADQLIFAIEGSPTDDHGDSPAVPVIFANAALGTIAQAIAKLSDQAANPVIIMNKGTWAAFKTVQYASQYGADPFEGLTVVFNNTLKAYDAASTDETYAIVGDLGYGALANFPNGDEINIKYDEYTLATSDLVRIIGRMFVGIGVVAPYAFCRIQKAGGEG